MEMFLLRFCNACFSLQVQSHDFRIKLSCTNFQMPIPMILYYLPSIRKDEMHMMLISSSSGHSDFIASTVGFPKFSIVVCLDQICCFHSFLLQIHQIDLFV